MLVVSISSFNVLSLSSIRAPYTAVGLCMTSMTAEALWMAWNGAMFRRSCWIVLGATLAVGAEGWRHRVCANLTPMSFVDMG